jgi:hypothetical protein
LFTKQSREKVSHKIVIINRSLKQIIGLKEHSITHLNISCIVTIEEVDRFKMSALDSKTLKYEEKEIYTPDLEEISGGKFLAFKLISS